MRKLISSINITLDGFCDHTAVIADDELHQQANELLKSADTILFGRTTYRLMEAGWPPLVKKPSGNKPMDEFAVLIDNIHKIVFSQTLKKVNWKNTKLAAGGIKEEVEKLKQQSGRNILVGSPTLIETLTQLGLIDEYQFCVQPIILSKGLPLFRNISQRFDLTLLSAKTFASGVVTLNYKPVKKDLGKSPAAAH